MLLLPSLALFKVSFYGLDLFFTCMRGFAYMYVCVVPCAYSAKRAQKRVSDHPELELQVG